MKRFLLAAILATMTGPANAGPYIGADYQFSIPFWNTPLFLTEPQHFSGGDVHAGWRSGPVALEAGYFLGGGDRMTLQGPTLDAFVFVPLGRSSVKLFATGGGADLQLSDHAATPPFDSSALTWRVGGGLEWQLDARLSARMTLRYQDWQFGHRMAGAETASFGLNYALGN